METQHLDPFEQAWPADKRAAQREQCRENGRKAALAQVAGLPFDKLSAESRQDFAEDMGRARVVAFDAAVARAAAVLRSPEALGRELLARTLIGRSSLSADAIIALLASVGDDVFVMSMAGVR